jgi:ferredoxin/flavodoxin---NADP+ reductase
VPHVITQSCCSDASCVYACPVNCIQPTPDDPGFLAAEMLHIDPVTCVDCGACVNACPVGAIKPHKTLTEAEQPYLQINRDYFSAPRPRPLLARPPARLQVRAGREPLRVAVVGSGPAAMYAADEVLTIPGAQVDVYERLDEPYGLARFGVAPDHRLTRQVTRQLDVIAAQPGLRLHLSTEVGTDITHRQLLGSHHAVIYAVGAAADKPLGIPGAELAASATQFVAWYNGHPEHADRDFDLSQPRLVVIGNGNVALDVARILTADPDALADTDIAPHALAALRSSRVQEVVIAARRGPEHSAFTLPELVGLAAVPGVDLLTERGDFAGPGAGNHTGPHPDPGATAALATAIPGDDLKLAMLHGLPHADTLPGTAASRRRIRLRYGLTPVRVTGSDRATGVEFDRETLAAGTVLTSIGYRGVPLPQLPFDELAGTIPNTAGRVIDPRSGEPVPGTYVAGWIKRGPSGFIGTNRSCAQETVRALVEDFSAGRLGSERFTGAPKGTDKVALAS